MVGDARGRETPDLQSVLDALDDADCRTILHRLEEPMTAAEVAEECDIPMSTVYRKLDLLSDASLVSEGTEIRSDGHHTTTYTVAFDEVVISRDDDGIEVSITRPPETAEERLAAMWSEVRKET